MTVSTSTPRQSYDCNGASVDFTVPFPYRAASDVLAWVQHKTTGVVTVLVYGTDYSVNPASSTTGGTATLTTAWSDSYRAVFARSTSKTQGTDLLQNDNLPAETLEGNLDQLTMMVQDLAAQQGRSLRLPEGDGASDPVLPPLQSLKGKLLGFDATTGAPVAREADGGASQVYLGIPAVSTAAVDTSVKVVIQRAGSVTTGNAEVVDIADVVNVPIDQVDYSADATIAAAGMGKYLTNANASDAMTFTLPAGDDANPELWAYFARHPDADFPVTIQPVGANAFANAGDGESITIMEPGDIGVQWRNGVWVIFAPGPRVAYETPRVVDGKVHLSASATIDLTGASDASTDLVALFNAAAAGSATLEGQDARLSIGSPVTLQAPLHGPSFPRTSTQGRLELVPTNSYTAKTVTGAVNNGSGLIRLTVVGHGRSTGDPIYAADVGGLTAATGDWTVTAIDANTLDLMGSVFSGTFTSGGTIIYTPPVLDRVGSDGADLRNVFIGDPGNTSAGSISYPAVGLQLGRPNRSPDTTYKVGRSVVSHNQLFGVTVGMRVQGWTSDIGPNWIDNCAVGFHGDTLNACTVDVRIGGCRKALKLENSDNVRLYALIEDDNANMVASEVDGCDAFWGQFYLEHQTTTATDYLLKIGSTELVSGVLIFSVGATMSLTGKKVPILLDRFQGIVVVRGSAASMHGLIETTANTDAEIFYQNELGVWPLDNSKRLGRAYNHFPNGNLDAWVAAAAFPRGWYDVTISANVTVSQRDANSGHSVRRGRYAMRLTASSTGKQNRYVEFQIGGSGSPTCLALRGKTIRCGAWVWIPDTAEFAESDLGNQHCNVILNCYSYNGSATVNGSLLNGDYSHHTVRGQWNYLWTETVVQTDCTRIGVALYLQTASSGGDIVTAADAYIDLDSVTICEATVPLKQQMEGGLPDAPTIDATVAGGRVLMFTDVAGGSTDATQYFGVGDILEKLTPTSGASRTSVCVTAGAGGTAGNWKTEGALS